MRLERFITLDLACPLRRLCAPWCSTRNRVLPILMYHSVSDDSEPGVHPYYRVCTSPRRFREQMQWLKDHGCRGVSTSAGLKWLTSRGTPDTEGRSKDFASSELPAVGNGSFVENSRPTELRPVVLTFDDGFRDFYTDAWPILREFDFTATMYLPTAYINAIAHDPSSRRCHSKHGKDYLAWEEVQEAHRAGIEFGSHTVHHPELIHQAWPEIQSEISDSKADIEQHLGASVTGFAYPYAFPQGRRDFVRRFRDLLLACGYQTCVTTKIGRTEASDDLLQLRRLPINQNDDPALFGAKLDGAYDWLAWPQALVQEFKRVKARSDDWVGDDARPRLRKAL